MKKSHNQEVPQEFAEIFGKPLSLADALLKQLKSAENILDEIEATKRQDGE